MKFQDQLVVVCVRCISLYSLKMLRFQRKPLVELCINMTNTELVIVEDCSDRDTNAIIIKVESYFFKQSLLAVCLLYGFVTILITHCTTVKLI